jgi:tRNA(adenine34) deaminase
MTTDEKYMTMALHEAHLAYEQGEIPVGCVIVADAGNQPSAISSQQSVVIGRGHNLTQMLHDVTAHAEMQAITAATETLGGKYLQGCTLYVTVEPCILCAGAIGWAQISRLVYGASDPKRGYVTFAPQALHPKCTVTSGVLADECQQLMQEFFLSKRK